jgi:hypothetical protein
MKKKSWADAFPSKFLKAGDIGDVGARKRVTIDCLDYVEMGKPPVDKLVAYFTGLSKALVVNPTNGRTLAKAFGEEIAACHGKEIDLVVREVEYAGETMLGIRIAIPKMAAPSPRQHAATRLVEPNEAELNRRLAEAAAADQGDADIPF